MSRRRQWAIVGLILVSMVVGLFAIILFEERREAAEAERYATDPVYRAEVDARKLAEDAERAAKAAAERAAAEEEAFQDALRKDAMFVVGQRGFLREGSPLCLTKDELDAHLLGAPAQCIKTPGASLAVVVGQDGFQRYQVRLVGTEPGVIIEGWAPFGAMSHGTVNLTGDETAKGDSAR